MTILGVRVGSRSWPLHVLLRPVRGRGGYDDPLLTVSGRKVATDADAIPIGSAGLELVVWCGLVEGEAESEIEAALPAGRFIIPGACPIAPGELLEGVSYAAHFIEEKYDRIVCHGSGALWSGGFAVANGAATFADFVRTTPGVVDAAGEVAALMQAIAACGDYGEYIRKGRRIGVVERLERSHPGLDPSAIAVRAEKPDLKGADPCRQLTFSRASAPTGALRLHVELYSSDYLIVSRVIAWPESEATVTVEADGHITKVRYRLFAEGNGELVDAFEASFLQSIQFSLIAEIGKDDLGKPFPGARPNTELEKRGRISPSAHGGPSAGRRAGGIDDLGDHRRTIESFIGRDEWRGEVKWFGVGADPQSEVITWIKRKLESPEVSKAFLVDPFLGSEALKRVILRQGNETIALDVLVSPGRIDPDADIVDAADRSGEYLSALAKAADELRDKLCGTIRIRHIKRGEGKKQAFHDRYLVLVEHGGIPRVFSLSNSLSKAAGDWPFLTVELDRVHSHGVANYVAGLAEGGGVRDLNVEEVWASAGAEEASRLTQPAPDVMAEDERAFSEALRKAYFDFHIIMREDSGLRDEEAAREIVATLVRSWPERTVDDELMGAILHEGMGQREEISFWLADLLAEQGRFVAVAQSLRQTVTKGVLERLMPAQGTPAGWPHSDEIVLGAGRTIANRPKVTNWVRDALNPIVHRYALGLETGAISGDRKGDWLMAGVTLAAIGLTIAEHATSADARHREGVASDYVRLFARFVRTPIAHDRLGELDIGMRWTTLSYVISVAKSLATKYPSVGVGLKQLAEDSFVPDAVRADISG